MSFGACYMSFGACSRSSLKEVGLSLSGCAWCCSQGIRRVIAVTASEAEEAVSRAEGLTKAMDAAEKLDGAKLDAEIASLRQVHYMRAIFLPTITSD